MVDYKITKVQKLLEVNNDMVHNYYFIYYGKIYNEDKTRIRRFKYIEWFDIFDVMEYFEKDSVSEKDIREFAYNLENSDLMCIRDFNDTEHLKEFYNYCNDTIKNYNSISKFY